MGSSILPDRVLFLGLAAAFFSISFLACSEKNISSASSPAPMEKTYMPSPSPSSAPEVVRSEEEWKKLLTSEQFLVTRMRGTERAHGAAYHEFEKQGEGTYYCVACGVELFTSKEKFASGCGWPSFYDASKAKNVFERRDTSHGMLRIETVCRRCDSHLGHVFEGEGFKTPTDRRFCINAAALRFVPKGGAPPTLLPANSPEVAKNKTAIAKEEPSTEP